MSRRRVVVTGLGAITPLGLDVPSFWGGLVEARSGIGPITSFPVDEFPVKFGGEVRGFDPERCQDRRDARHTDRYAQFALHAADEALKDAGIELEKLDRDRCGAILGAGIGGIRTMGDEALVMAEKGARRVTPFLVPKMMINAAVGQLAIRYRLCGPNFTVASACASANHAIGLAFQNIVLNQSDLMFTGGSEAALVPLGLAGFCSARALSTRNEAPEQASRPFDKGRDGFVLSEGAGVLVLEELEHARRRGAKIYCEILGFGMSDDAYHITAPHEEGLGAIKAMKRALADGGLTPEAVDYVNAHGTSTPLGDRAETVALKSVFQDHARRLAISSTKSMVGHLLGASGGVEAIALAKTIETGIIHPTRNLDDPDPECDLDYVPKVARQRSVRIGISNSFGFGGHNTTLMFGRYDGSRPE